VALWDARVHVGASNGSNIAPIIERVVDEEFCFGPVLRVPYI